MSGVRVIETWGPHWKTSRDITLADVRKLESRIAELEAALRALVEREPVSYGIHEEDISCAYCEGEILTESRSKHAADCPWAKAKELLSKEDNNG